MLTIAFIDRFPIIRTGAQICLKESLQEVNVLTAQDIVSFQDQFPDEKPDILILGIDSKSLTNPLIFIPVVKKMFDCPVIVYDDIATDQLCLKYFSAGANGYVSKCNPRTELINCIQSIMQKKNYATSEALEMFVAHLQANPDVAKTGLSELTRHEYKVAQYLSKGMAISTIAKKLERTSSAISAAKKRIFRKLNVNDIAKLNDIVYN